MVSATWGSMEFAGQAIEGLAWGNSMESRTLSVVRTQRNAQGLSGIDALVGTRIQAQDIALTDAIHTGYGVQALTFFDGVHEVGLVFLSPSREAHRSRQEQGAD